jgi:hypothetical protein
MNKLSLTHRSVPAVLEHDLTFGAAEDGFRNCWLGLRYSGTDCVGRC